MFFLQRPLIYSYFSGVDDFLVTYPNEIRIAAIISKQYIATLAKRLFDLNLSAVPKEFFNTGKILYLKVNECNSSRIKCTKHPANTTTPTVIAKISSDVTKRR
jgi:hypothetical protein